MTQSRTSDEAIYRLIRQGVDDARFQLGSAISIMEMRGTLSEDVLSRVDRAMSQYEQSQDEFAIQFDNMSARGRSIIASDLVDLWKKFWFAMSCISRMAKGNLVFYNRIRDLRHRFVVSGELAEQRAQASGGL